jgi:hypothetical protein
VVECVEFFFFFSFLSSLFFITMHATTRCLAAPSSSWGVVTRAGPARAVLLRRPLKLASPGLPPPLARPSQGRTSSPPAATNPFAALFSGKKSTDAGTAALVDEILALARTTRAGVRTEKAKLDAIADLAAKLSKKRTPRPTASALFWGDYAVYSTNPAAPGGPVLTSGLGRAALREQRPVQRLEPVREEWDGWDG